MFVCAVVAGKPHPPSPYRSSTRMGPALHTYARPVRSKQPSQTLVPPRATKRVNTRSNTPLSRLRLPVRFTPRWHSPLQSSWDLKYRWQRPSARYHPASTMFSTRHRRTRPRAGAGSAHALTVRGRALARQGRAHVRIFFFYVPRGTPPQGAVIYYTENTCVQFWR